MTSTRAGVRHLHEADAQAVGHALGEAGHVPGAFRGEGAGSAFKTGTKEVFTLNTVEGYQLRLTADHRVMTVDGWKETQHLQPGDRIHIANTEGLFGTRGDADAGMLAGWVTGDGSR